MMKILIDWRGTKDPFGGVSRYVMELLRHFGSRVDARIAQCETENPELLVPPYSFSEAKMSLSKFLPGIHIPGKYRAYLALSRCFPHLFPSIEVNNSLCMRKLFKGREFDVFHMVQAHDYGTEWREIAGRKPIVITVHDLIPELLMDNNRIRKLRREVLDAASHIIAISEYTKQDLMRLYDISDDRITVIHHGWTPWAGVDIAPIFPEMEYILYVGGRRGYKNFDFFVRAVAPVLRRHPSLHLVCTGLAFTGQERALFSSLGIADRVVHSFIPNEQMHSLYANAKLFVYPSRYEGFGIPILDAFAAGCPVILSDCSCFPEVGGDAALYFHDDDREQLAGVMDSLLDNPELRIMYIKRGHDRVKNFTWEKAANATIGVYEKVVANCCTCART